MNKHYKKVITALLISVPLGFVANHWPRVSPFNDGIYYGEGIPLPVHHLSIDERFSDYRLPSILNYLIILCLVLVLLYLIPFVRSKRSKDKLG